MGELFAVLSALFFGFNNVLVKKGTTKDSKDNGVFISIILTGALAGLFVLIFGLIRGFPPLSAEGMLWFCLAGFFTAFVGRVAHYSSIQHLGSVRASAIKRLTPFFSVVLGTLLLGETITLTLFLGMLLILSSIALMIYNSFSEAKKNKALPNPSEAAAAAAPAEVSASGKLKTALFLIGNLGFFYGPISALAYSFGYIARKQGLTEIPDPFFGAMLGGCTGVVLFSLFALYKANYRYAFISSFTTFRPLLFTAGVANSGGQILYFFALAHSTVIQVSLISTLEVFITIFLSVWIFKTREQLNATVLIACFISVIGAAIIVLS